MKTSKLLCAFLLMLFFCIPHMVAQKILFLTNQVPTTNQSDLTVIQALEDEAYDVVVKLSQSFDKSTDLEGVDCIFISEAIGSGDPASLYASELAGEIGIAVINNEPYGYNLTDRLPWAYGARKGNTDYARLFISEAGATHPIAVKAGFTAPTMSEEEAVIVLARKDEGGTAPKMCYVGMEDVTAGTVIGWDGSTEEGTGNKALLFAIEKGTEMKPGVVATGRRVGFFIANGNNELTDEGKAFLLAAVSWGIEGNDLDVSGIQQSKTGVKYLYANNRFTFKEGPASVVVYNVAGKVCRQVSDVSSFIVRIWRKAFIWPASPVAAKPKE